MPSPLLAQMKKQPRDVKQQARELTRIQGVLRLLASGGVREGFEVEYAKSPGTPPKYAHLHKNRTCNFGGSGDLTPG